MIEVVTFHPARRGRTFKPLSQALEIVEKLPLTTKQHRVRGVFDNEKFARTIGRQVRKLNYNSVVTIRPIDGDRWELFAYDPAVSLPC